MEYKNCKPITISETTLVEDTKGAITNKANFEKTKLKKHKKNKIKVKKLKKSDDNEPEIIVIDDEDPIKTEEKFKKPKSKKQKRKVKLGKNYLNNMETLYITQKLKVKKTKFSCVININSGSKTKKQYSSSIIRSSRLVCRREAYYNRIVPICMRDSCFPGKISGINCCQTSGTSKYRLEKGVLFSPISSSPLPCSDPLSLDDITDNSFSSQDELDTLIKRTKEREHQFIFPVKAYDEPFSCPPTNEDVASTYSYSGESLHSTSTMVLPPLETEAYSPTSPGTRCNVESYPDALHFYSMEDVDGVNSPYSPSDPTNTMDINEDEVYNCGLNDERLPSFDGQIKVKIEDQGKNDREIDCMQIERDSGRDDLIKIENIKREVEDYFNNGQIFETEVNINDNVQIKCEKLKRENECEYDINDNFKVFVKIEKS